MKPIKLGNETVLQVTNNIIYSNIIDNLENTYNIKMDTIKYKFLDKNNIKDIKSNNYSIILNTNGQKYFLFFTKYQNKYYSVYISKKTGNMYLVKIRVDKALYTNTLFEGDILKNNNRWYFYISDIILYKGEDIQNYSYENRYNKIKYFYNNDYIIDKMFEAFVIIIKDKFNYSQIKYIEETYVNTCPFKINGLLFKPNFTSNNNILYIFPKFRQKKNNTDKEKKNTSNLTKSTKDNNSNDVNSNTQEINNIKNFIINNTEYPDLYELYNLNNSYDSYACIPNMDKSKKVRLWFEKENKSKLKVECKYNILFKKWVPEKIVL